MLLQVRSPNGACHVCGSTELLLETGTGTELSESLKPILARMLASAESELVQIWNLEQQDRDRAVGKANAALVGRVRKLSPSRARRYRIFKRRWQQELDSQIEEAVNELVERTRFV